MVNTWMLIAPPSMSVARGRFYGFCRVPRSIPDAKSGLLAKYANTELNAIKQRRARCAGGAGWGWRDRDSFEAFGAPRRN